MPRPDQLPPDLAQLSFHNGMQLRPDPDFHKDVDRLLKAIRNLPLHRKPNPDRRRLAATLADGRKGAIVGMVLALAWSLISCVIIFAHSVNADLILVLTVVSWRSDGLSSGGGREERALPCWRVACCHYWRRPFCCLLCSVPPS